MTLSKESQNSKGKSQECSSKFKSDIKQRCYIFSLEVIKLIGSLPNSRSSWIISDQLIRSATSVGANIIESKSASSRLEFKRYYEISLKSANETKYWLGLLRDSGLCESIKINTMLKEITEISNILAASVISLKNK